MTPVTPGELLEVAAGLRKLGVAGFKYRDCEVTFYEPLPLEMQEEKQQVKGYLDEDWDEEDEAKRQEAREKRVAQLRKQMLDADIHGSA